MASTRERAFQAFDKDGPDARTASEWAEELDTSKDYVYQLRGDYKEQAAEEQATDGEESHEAPEPTDAPDDDPEPLREETEAAQGNGPESEPSATTSEASAPETTDPESSTPSATSTTEQTEPTEPEPARSDSSSSATEQATDGGTVSVSHEGSEKLSPAGFEEESVSSIDPPDGVELPDDVGPDDFEPDDGPREPQARDHDPEPEQEPEPEDSGGGVLSRLTGGSEDEPSESTEDVVQDAPDDAERERREQVLGALDEATGSGATTAEADPDPDGDPDPTTMSNGMVVDEELVGSLFGMPFEQAANATGWDGWTLSPAEKEANARLIVAYCDEQDIDLSTGSMLAMSLLSTVGGRAAGYARHRKSEQGDDADASARDHDPEPTEAEPTEAEPAPEESTDTSEPEPSETTDEQTAAEAPADGESFDFHDSSTW